MAPMQRHARAPRVTRAAWACLGAFAFCAMGIARLRTVRVALLHLYAALSDAGPVELGRPRRPARARRRGTDRASTAQQRALHALCLASAAMLAIACKNTAKTRLRVSSARRSAIGRQAWRFRLSRRWRRRRRQNVVLLERGSRDRGPRDWAPSDANARRDDGWRAANRGRLSAAAAVPDDKRPSNHRLRPPHEKSQGCKRPAGAPKTAKWKRLDDVRAREDGHLAVDGVLHHEAEHAEHGGDGRSGAPCSASTSSRRRSGSASK